MDSRRLIHKRYRDSRERRRQAGWMDGGRFSERARKKKTCWNRLSLRSRMNRLVRSANQTRRTLAATVLDRYLMNKPQSI